MIPMVTINPLHFRRQAIAVATAFVFIIGTAQGCAPQDAPPEEIRDEKLAIPLIGAATVAVLIVAAVALGYVIYDTASGRYVVGKTVNGTLKEALQSLVDVASSATSELAPETLQTLNDELSHTANAVTIQDLLQNPNNENLRNVVKRENADEISRRAKTYERSANSEFGNNNNDKCRFYRGNHTKLRNSSDELLATLRKYPKNISAVNLKILTTGLVGELALAFLLSFCPPPSGGTPA